MSEHTWVSTSMPYVRPRSEGQGDAWSEEAAQHGGTGTQLLREVVEAVAPGEVAERLQLPPGSRVIVRRRTVLLDDQPVELADSYYPLAVAQGTGLAENRKIRGGAVALLRELGYEPRSAEEDVSARPPSDEERQMLRMDADGWVLVVLRTLRAEDGTPVEVSDMKMIAPGRHLRYDTTL
ncbi:GntR family transcriptional regulator [Sphaerisporangium dianthi]|uniref:GntR family transcriptional regulator n=1 Tax=Sphaerisporangium dianthi TaxID=1436120 RepID=A0ABV9CUE6_9ACTN